MPETKRQIIVNHVVAKYREIRQANGYETDVGQRVFVWRDVPLRPEQTPAIIVRDLDEIHDLPSARAFANRRSLHMMIQIAAVGDNAVETARAVIGDLDHATRELRDSEPFASLISAIRPRINRMVLDQEEFRFSASTFEYYIDYATRAFDSYE